MEVDAEIHSQALGQAPGVLLKKVRRNCAYQEVKLMMGEHTETGDLSLWELMDSGPTVRKHAWNQARPSVQLVCDRYVVCSVRNVPSI